MRILLFNSQSACAGGIEIYLQRLVPLLQQRGHQVAFVHEHPAEPGYEPVVAADTPGWCVLQEGEDRVRQAVAAWAPDVFYCHAPAFFALLDQWIGKLPSVYFAHAYMGLCISGSKQHQWPVARPCSRPFGMACLLHYLPRRCGGLSPVTMLRYYRQQQDTLRKLRRFGLVLTHSEHLRTEFLTQGFPAERVRAIPFLVPEDSVALPRPATSPGEPLRLLFLGRMEKAKGGNLLIQSLGEVRSGLRRGVELVMAGSGRERDYWERLAREVMTADAGINIRFPGWLGEDARRQAFQRADLLVVPSTWPEPFGQVGVEAGLAGLPAVAFDVGGVRAWLTDGENGAVAPANPPSSQGLAQAIQQVAALENQAALASGAVRLAQRFAAERHLIALERSLQSVI